MKTILITFFLGLSTILAGQIHLSSDTMIYRGDDPIHVEKLASDSLATSFLIWVKNEVRAHFHARHTEYVMVLEGSGEMSLGLETFTIAPGDIIYIPMNTAHSVLVTSEMPLKVLSIQTPEFRGKDRIFVRPYQQSTD